MLTKYCAFILLASVLIALSEGQGQGGQRGYCSAGPPCSNVSECHCGDICVDMTDLKVCHSTNCQCFQGCAVGEIFILPGVTRENTYCNQCSCPARPTDGTPACTRRQWCNLPCNGQIYQDNPNCRGRARERRYET